MPATLPGCSGPGPACSGTNGTTLIAQDYCSVRTLNVLKRKIDDGREVSNTEETTIVVQRFEFLEYDDDGNHLFDCMNQINMKAVNSYCNDLQDTNAQGDSKAQPSNGRSSDELLGWFAFNRAYHDDYLDNWEQVTENLLKATKCKKPALFILAFDRIVGSELKLTFNDTNIRAYVFAENRFKPVDFTFTNLGDTSHKEYTEILDRRAATPLDDGFLQDCLAGSNPDTLTECAVQQAELMITSATATITNLIDQISLDPYYLEYMNSSPPSDASDHSVEQNHNNSTIVPPTPTINSFLLAPVPKLSESTSTSSSTKLVNFDESSEALKPTSQKFVSKVPFAGGFQQRKSGVGGPKQQENNANQQQDPERLARTIFVGGIPWRASPEQVRNLFAREDGQIVVNFQLVRDHDGFSRGFGFCEFSTQEMADYAVETMDGVELYPRRLHVDYAKRKDFVGF